VGDKINSIVDNISSRLYEIQPAPQSMRYTAVFCNEAYFQRTHPSNYEKTGAEHLEINKIFPRSDRDGYRLQHPVPLPDDI
jgi:hypothetical protein